MLVMGFSDAMKVLNMCLKLLDYFISRRIFEILNALTTRVELPS